MKDTIILGGGCFWCLEAVFQRVQGVNQVISGYTGGSIKNPAYREVCSGTTGHAEVIQIEFEPEQITLEQILKIFFTVHDPTTLNRQGNDVGSQYRSCIFYRTEQQKMIAEQVIQNFASQAWEKPIVTTVELVSIFYPAEQYHQNYYRNNPDQGYCQVIIQPKVNKLRKEFASLFIE